MVEFKPLASSSAGNAYLLTSPGLAPLLIDCGLRFAQIREAMEFRATGLAGCLVSHAHGDHCTAIPDLLSCGVEIYTSAGTWKAVKKGAYFAHHRANVVEPHKPFKVGPWLVTAFEVVHDAEDTFGFVVDGEGERLVYLTDTAYSKYRFEGATILAVEANWGESQMRENSRDGRIHGERFRRTATNHMSIERLERFLDANDLSKVREIHLLHLSDANSDEQEFADRVRRKTGKPVYIAAKQAGVRDQVFAGSPNLPPATSQGGVN